ncbi:hypothetical protein ACI2KR_30525 [Pseudomonas luteola]
MSKEANYLTKEPFIVFEGNSFKADGIQLIDFGWYGTSDTEHFFAVGHLPQGMLLSHIRKLTGHHLIGWTEHLVTVYQHWHKPLNQPWDQEPLMCWSTYSLNEKSPTNEPYRKRHAIKATVLRHCAWEFMDTSKYQEMQKLNYACKRFKDWYTGLTMTQNRTLQPWDVLYDFLPGFCVFGIMEGRLQEALLEWPLSNFGDALWIAQEWGKKGASQLSISYNGVAFMLEDLTVDRIQNINRAIKSHGLHVSFAEIS